MAEPLRTTATNFKQSVGKYLDAARTGRVIIERQGRPTAVLLSIEEYERLDPGSGRLLDALTGEFEALVAEMAAPKYGAAMAKAFDASPEDLGAAYQRGRRRKRARA
jgi:prevent-host-death family protein